MRGERLISVFHVKIHCRRQVLTHLGDRRRVNGYLEVGSPGRYISDLQDHVDVEGEGRFAAGVHPQQLERLAILTSDLEQRGHDRGAPGPAGLRVDGRGEEKLWITSIERSRLNSRWTSSFK